MSARILIIEDTPNNLTLMAYLLESAGHKLLKASSAITGLEIARTDIPDLIVMDIQMPGMDGYEALEKIRADDRLRHMVVLAVTAYAMVGNREQVLAAGFNGYLAKPIDPETFVIDVEALLPEALRSPHVTTASQPNIVAIDKSIEHTQTVLVVDDLATNVTLLRSILETRGLRVLDASNVDDALRIVNTEDPVLVLSDMNIAGESGVDFLHRLDASKQLSKMTFAFVTATWTGNDSLFSELGVEVIRRPIEPEQLLQKIDALLKSDDLRKR